MMLKKMFYSSVATFSSFGLAFNTGSVVFANDSDGEDYSILFRERFIHKLDEKPDYGSIFHSDDRIEFCPNRLCELANEEFWDTTAIYNIRYKFLESGE